MLPYIFGSDDLLCSDPNLIVSTTRPTTFCQIQGIHRFRYILITYITALVHLGLAVQAGALIVFGFWLIHLFHLLHGLLYPFKAQTLMKSPHLRRTVHIIEVIVTLACGLTPNLIIVGTSGYQHFAFPPVCSNELPEVTFYTFIFPISIGATVGLCMLLISFVILRKVAM